jgi:hypothetical protein
MKALKEENSRSTQVSGIPQISDGIRKSAHAVNRIHDLYMRMAPKKHTLATIVTSGIFRYALFSRKGTSVDIESFGELSKSDFLLDSNDPLDLHRAGLNWIDENTDLTYRDILVISSDIDFFVRRLKLPPLKKSEIMEVASWEVNKQIPISIEDSYLFIKRDKKQAGKSAITMGAVPRIQVDRWQCLGEGLAGVIPSVASLAALGPKASSAETVYCYVYQTDSEIDIGFYNSEGLQYYRTAPATSAGYEIGMPQSRSGSPKIVEELTNSIEVLYSHFPGMKVEGIVLLIPPDEVPGLSEAISEQIEIKIISVDPYSGMSREAQELWADAGPKYLPLLGAALIGAEDFRFFPQSITERIKKKRINKLIRYILFFGIFVEIFAASLWIDDVLMSKSELTHLQTLKEKMENSDAYVQSVEYQSRARFLTALGDQFSLRNDDYSRLLKTFSSITPSGIYLENVSVVRREGKLHLSIGAYYDGDLSKTDVAMMNFMESLDSRGIQQLRLQRLGKKLSGDRNMESFVLEGKK